ncbi:MAG: UDP-N-acetylmuramoyl-tripeptide--D-alanyl-D-alanine ligase [Candidatus Marinimicrobia bacterium]|nr:UDP-N-acetylmuramoyl-tripeptide--D-alanyl-D-alanine ligase [Candidatus Neomarinimicrobiota bacterium]
MRIDIKNPEKFSQIFTKVTGQILKTPVTGIVTDSRECQEGDLYIALTGERVDGHRFLETVNDLGASVALVAQSNDAILRMQQVVVGDPLKTIGRIARNWRRQYDIPIIGITGSNGKTSTKELLFHILESNFKVHATQGNFNTSIGLPLTLLTLDGTHSISILEMGANQPGDIDYLCQITEPTHGLITNIAPAHLAGFGNIDIIAETKGALFKSLENGISFVNLADEKVQSIPTYGDTVSFGLTADCDFPVDIHEEENGNLTLTIDAEEVQTESQNFSFIKNMISAASIAISLGISWDTFRERIKTFTPPAGRCQVKQFNDITVIDDTYNANLSSSLAALDYLKAFSGNGRRIFVFGDMFELGKSSQKQHEKIGLKCSKIGLDAVYTIGDETVYTDKVISRGFHQHFKAQESLIQALKNGLQSGDKVLIKGSRGMAMEKIISGVFQS